MKLITVFLILIAVLASSGCMFIGLGEDVKRLDAAVSISGTVDGVMDDASPVVVVLSHAGGDDHSVQAYGVVYGDGEFSLSAPAGDYYLLAFEDRNHDFTLQPDERVGWYGSPTRLETQAGEAYERITLNLLDPEVAKTRLPELYVPGETHQPVNFQQAKLGEVVEISVFQEALGPMGMWEPVKFHLEGNSGIYFLEPYDPQKTPVLFVHGISGSGHDWIYLVDQLDRQRFQPWIVQYPSGMRLGLLSKALNQSMNELRAIHNFDRLVVVAHSMGGLVSRGFINEHTSTGNSTVIDTFVTISTPWLGHDAATQGVKYAPVAVPSWFDMVPGSPYLNSLYEHHLPDDIEYFLLFSHKGKGSGVLSRSNTDGTVTLRSQLPLHAQELASLVMGYDEDHVSILKSPEVSAKLSEILSRESRLNPLKR